MPSLVRYIYNTYFNRLKLGRVEIWDSGSAVNLIQAPLQEALDVVGSVDDEKPSVGADMAGEQWSAISIADFYIILNTGLFSLTFYIKCSLFVLVYMRFYPTL